MKRVTVRLHGGLERYTGRRGGLELLVNDEATLAAVQDLLGIPKGEVAFFLVDQELRTESDLVQEGSTIDLYPVFGGG